MKVGFLFPIEGIVPRNVTYSEQDMGESLFTMSISIPRDIIPKFDISGRWSVSFRHETYRLKSYSPIGRKSNESLMYEYDLVFVSEREDLSHRIFSTFVQLADGSLQIFSQTVPFVADIVQFVDRFNQNLRYHFGSRWRMELNPGTRVDAQTVQANNASIWDVLSQLYDLYGLRWSIEEQAGQMVIKVGYPPVEIEHIFEYGIENGLISISRENTNEEIITRLYGRGGGRNIPVRYFKNQSDEFEGDPDYNPNLDTSNFPVLQPISTRRYVQGWNDSSSGSSPNPPSDIKEAYFYNLGFDDFRLGRNMYLPNYAESENISRFGIREGVIDDNDDIFPSIQNIWLGNKGRADEVVFVESVTNDNRVEYGKEFSANAISLKSTFNFNEGTYQQRNESTSMLAVSDKDSYIQFKVSRKNNADLFNYFEGNITLELRNGGLPVSVIGIDVNKITDETLKFDIANPGTYTINVTTHVTYTGGLVGSLMNPWISIDVGNIKVVNRNEYKPIFDIYIKDIWEESGSISDIWSSKISTSNLTVMFSTGDIAGSDNQFVVARSGDGNPELPDPNGGYWHIWEDSTKSITTESESGGTVSVPSKWRISLIKSDSEKDASNLMIPNTLVNAKAGDNFFFTNIEMPHQYVVWAEQRLQRYLDQELSLIDDEYPALHVGLSKIFCAEFEEIDKVSPGSKLRVRNVVLMGDGYTPIYINSMQIRWDNEKLLPSIELTISDKLVGNKSPVQVLDGEIKKLSSGFYGGGISDESVRSMERVFLRKDGVLDRSYSPTIFEKDITVNQNIQSGDFRQGDFGGSGWAAYRDTTGASVIETDKIVVRREMRVNEILVNQILFTGGKQVFSGAGGTIERIESFPEQGLWRCYIDTKSGSLMNHFQVDDQAYHQDFDVNSNELLRYYWRLITGVGTDYVDISMEDTDGLSEPQVGDNIAQLGNRSNTDRQSALMIDMVRDGGGLVTWYDDINSYSLTQKDSVNIGRIEGKTWVQAYGNAYFGNREKTKYLRYQDGLVEISGAVTVGGGGSVVDFIPVFRGNYNSTTTYYQGDMVHDNGAYFVYINPNPSTGHPTSSSEYWQLRTQSAEADSMYTWIKYSDYKNPSDDQVYDIPRDTTSYIGQAFNKSTPTESDTAADYVWIPYMNTDGRDGNSYEFVFRRTNTSAPPQPNIELEPAQQIDGYSPANWFTDPTGVSVEYQWEWVSKRSKINGVWTTFSPAAIFSVYGEDGNGSEFIYRRTTTNENPSTPTGDYPAEWTQYPVGVNATYQWEWVSFRRYVDEQWTTWSTPGIFSKYGNDGGIPIQAFARHENPSKPTFAGVEPNPPWYRNDPGTPENLPVWISYGLSRQDASGNWYVDNITDPVRITGNNGLNGRSLNYVGDYSNQTVYIGNDRIAQVIRYRPNPSSQYVYYYTTATVGNSTLPPPLNHGSSDSNWIVFGNSFESVATNILFANEGTLGDFRFHRTSEDYGVFESLDGGKNIYLNSTTGKARFKDVEISGTISSVWAGLTSGGTMSENSDNVILAPTSSVINLPWDSSINGRTIRLLHWNVNSSSVGQGSIISAPTGHTFYENGLGRPSGTGTYYPGYNTVSSISIQHELVELIGFQENWIVKSRTPFQSRYEYGKSPSVLAMGTVTSNGSNAPSIRYSCFDDYKGTGTNNTKQRRYSSLSARRDGTGLYTITFPSWWGLSNDGDVGNQYGYSVITTGMERYDNTGQGCYASVMSKSFNSFQVRIAIDAQARDGSFMFQIIRDF